jgi:hypothetical protein
VVLDVDPRHGGDESLAALEREHVIPPTWRTLTGGGGQHIIFACPDGVKISSVAAEHMIDPPLGPGIDLRARSGHVITPPSQHISGGYYRWAAGPEDVPLAIAPAPLIKRLLKRGMAHPDGTPIEPISADFWKWLTREPVSKYREVSAARIASHLLQHKCDFPLVVGLLHVWNEGVCKPPLPSDELERIIINLAKQAAGG